jgi:hypothetical protein
LPLSTSASSNNGAVTSSASIVFGFNKDDTTAPANPGNGTPLFSLFPSGRRRSLSGTASRRLLGLRTGAAVSAAAASAASASAQGNAATVSAQPLAASAAASNGDGVKADAETVWDAADDSAGGAAEGYDWPQAAAAGGRRLRAAPRRAP